MNSKNKIKISEGDCLELEEHTYLKNIRKLPYNGRFFMIYSNSIKKLMAAADEATLTLLYLAAGCKTENQVYVRINEIASGRGISRATVERHLKKLRDIGAMVPDPAEKDVLKGIHLWRISPHIVWVGGAHEMRAYMEELPRDHPFQQWQPNEV